MASAGFYYFYYSEGRILEQFLKLGSKVVILVQMRRLQLSRPLFVFPAEAGSQRRFPYKMFRLWRIVRVLDMAGRVLRALDASLRWQDGGRRGGW
jgi:hypothetical protein